MLLILANAKTASSADMSFGIKRQWGLWTAIAARELQMLSRSLLRGSMLLLIPLAFCSPRSRFLDRRANCSAKQCGIRYKRQSVRNCVSRRSLWPWCRLEDNAVAGFMNFAVVAPDMPLECVEIAPGCDMERPPSCGQCMCYRIVETLGNASSAKSTLCTFHSAFLRFRSVLCFCYVVS